MKTKDNNWNILYTINAKGKEKYYLKIKWEEYDRHIGDYADGTFLTRRKREKHLYQRTQSYWFNDFVLRHLIKEYWEINVVIKEVWNKILRLSTALTILKWWDYLRFSTQWFEKQIFFPLDKFEIWVKIPEPIKTEEVLST